MKSIVPSAGKRESILSVVTDGLCTGCGTCASFCPQEAIRIVKDDTKGVYLPRVLETQCNSCGLCYKVCPGYEEDLQEFAQMIFGAVPENALVGHCIHSYAGYTTRNYIRYGSSSGGLITQILVYALETGLIDGALVTRSERSAPLEPKPFIARTAEEIISARGSTYCPVATNIALKDLLASDGKYAVVGLPCQIRAIRKAERFSARLKSQLVLHLGIFCGGSSTFGATRFLLDHFGISEAEVENIAYRGDGWPGHLTIQTPKGVVSTNYPDYYERFSAFIPWRCTLCSDQTSELADISLGDAWLPEFADDKIGTSVILSRNDSGEDLLQQMVGSGVIQLAPLSISRVTTSQNSGLLFKKRDLSARLQIAKILGKRTPTIGDLDCRSPPLEAYVRSFVLYSERLLARSERRWWLLDTYCSALKSAGLLRRKLRR